MCPHAHSTCRSRTMRRISDHARRVQSARHSHGTGTRQHGAGHVRSVSARRSVIQWRSITVSFTSQARQRSVSGMRRGFLSRPGQGRGLRFGFGGERGGGVGGVFVGLQPTFPSPPATYTIQFVRGIPRHAVARRARWSGVSAIHRHVHRDTTSRCRMISRGSITRARGGFTSPLDSRGEGRGEQHIYDM